MKIPEELINAVTADVLDAAARESGLNQKMLAKKADMSAVTVQKLLSGNQSMKTHQFLALADATDLSATEIMGRIERAVARRVGAIDYSVPKTVVEVRFETASAALAELENGGTEAEWVAARDEYDQATAELLSERRATVEPIDNVTHLGSVTPPLAAAAETKDRVPGRD